MGCVDSKPSGRDSPEPTTAQQPPKKASDQPSVANETEHTVVNSNGEDITPVELSVHDDVTEREATGEEPDNPLPEADFCDGRLGVCHRTSAVDDIISKNLDRDGLWCDPEFPADDESLFYDTRRTLGNNPAWHRPKDQVEHPQLQIDGATREDIKQGTLGDCWFLSSCAAVSRVQRFMKQIMPDNQSLYGDEYRGAVHFRFYRFGEWVDVYVDDRLPTVFDPPQLAFAHCTERNEFWVGLLEKAYAKIHGSYQAIEGGQTMDALVDLTGGLAERYTIEGPDPQMYKQMIRAYKSGAFIACSIKGNWTTSDKADEHGLVHGHAYTVTNVMKVFGRLGLNEKLVRVRNPWGNDVEWKGEWSDGHRYWDRINEETKRKIDFENKEDGEFWMGYKDFCKHFQEVTICTLGPDFDGDGVTDTAGHVELVHGSWVDGESCGGSRNDIGMFATNPQFNLTLTEQDDFDSAQDDPESQGKCSVVIALMQEHRRSQRHLGMKTLQIGFILYKTDDPGNRLPADHFRYNYDSGTSGTYINYREKSASFELDPGHYVIIPTTFYSDCPGTFLIRVFAQKRFTLTGPL